MNDIPDLFIIKIYEIYVLKLIVINAYFGEMRSQCFKTQSSPYIHRSLYNDVYIKRSFGLIQMNYLTSDDSKWIFYYFYEIRLLAGKVCF